MTHILIYFKQTETPPWFGEQLKWKLINSEEIDSIRSICHL